MPQLDSETAWEIGTTLAAHGEDAADRFLPKMIWCGIGRLAPANLTRALTLANTTPLVSLADSIRWFASRSPQGRELLLESLKKQDSATVSKALRIMAFALKDDAACPPPKGWIEARDRIASIPDTALTDVADSLSALFGDQAVLTKLLTILADKSQAPERRQFAFNQLRRANDPASLPVFAGLLDNELLRSAVIPMLARSNDPNVAESLIATFASLKPEDQSAALNTLTSRPELATPLLNAMKSGRFSRNHVSSLHVRQMRNLKTDAINRLLDEAWGKVNESSAAAKDTIARLKKGFSAAPLWAYDAKAGAETFKQLCGICHAINGQGGNLGPDLGGSWRHGVDYFLENIVDPNAVIGENFQLQIITRKDGAVVSGLLDQESATAVTLRTTGQPVVVPKSEIARHERSSQSLMPAGLLEALPEKKAFELLKYLTSRP
jgi:putative heme-binding domain-containing protein